MKIQVMPRQTGKTNACVEWLLEAPDDRIIVVSHPPQRKHVLAKLHHIEPEIPKSYWEKRVFSAVDLRDTNKFRELALHLREVAIDDIDEVISALTALPRPKFGTITGKLST